MAKKFEKMPGMGIITSSLDDAMKKGNELPRLTVAIDKLQPCKFNSEIYDMDEDELEYLEKGIKEEGFHSSVTVCQLPDTPKGEYIILSGHRRVKAAEKAGEKFVPVIVRQVKDDAEMLKILISSNRKSRTDKPMAHAKEIQYYEEVIAPSNGITKKVAEYVAKELNLSVAQLTRYKALLKLIPELQELANNPEYSFSAFAKAASLTEDQQKNVYEEIMEYIKNDPEKDVPTRSVIISIIDSIKAGHAFKKDMFSGEPSRDLTEAYEGEKETNNTLETDLPVISPDLSAPDSPIIDPEMEDLPATIMVDENEFKPFTVDDVVPNDEGLPENVCNLNQVCSYIEPSDKDERFMVDMSVILTSLRTQMEQVYENQENYIKNNDVSILNEIGNIRNILDKLQGLIQK